MTIKKAWTQTSLLFIGIAKHHTVKTKKSPRLSGVSINLHSRLLHDKIGDFMNTERQLTP